MRRNLHSLRSLLNEAYYLEEDEEPSQKCGEGTFWNSNLKKCLPLDAQHDQLRQIADHGSYSAHLSNQRVDHVRAAVAHMDAAHVLHQAGFSELGDIHAATAAKHQRKLDKHNGCELDSHWNAVQGECQPLDSRHLELIRRAHDSSKKAQKTGQFDDHTIAHDNHRDVADALYQAGFKHLAHHHRKKSRMHASDATDIASIKSENPAGLPAEEQDTVVSH